MTQARTASKTRARLALLATAAVVSVLPLAVNAETVAGLDVSVGGTAASDPYLQTGSDNGGIGANLTVRPYLTATEEATTVRFNGALSLESFFDGRGTDESAQVRAGIEQVLNERTTVSADVSFQSSESAARSFYGGPDVGNLDPGEFPDTTVVDPTLGNVRGRTSRLDVKTGLSQRVSANGMINMSMGIGLTRTETGSGLDYRDTSTALSYSRQINERTSLRFSADAGYADYLGQRVGDGLFVTALAGVEHQLTETMYGSLQVGLSYADVKSPLGGRQDMTNWAADFNLCDGLARGTVCVTASKSARPTSLGGITEVSAVGVSYARSVGEDGHASFSATYSKSGVSNSPVLLARRDTKVAYVGGTYSHRLGRRVSAFITPSFAANEDEFTGKRKNYQVLAGLTYHFGKQ